ncbi:MAG: flagellar hook-length control protein FliK, partial [Marmoricola sp.]|nr:flagellar hook-length control protein FliK [Marmoricola sp.]
ATKAVVKPVVELAETPGVPATTSPGQAQQSPAPSTLPLTISVQLPPGTPTIATTTSHTPVPPSGVHAQVFGEVTSLVSRGPGVHRIALTLNPESLGPVRVVMTVRDGGVQVRLAAGSEAHQALLEGSGELSRMLERAGAGEAHVVVHEFTPVTATHSADSGQLNLGTGDRPTDQHAGTRADHSATDGADRLLTRRLPVQQEARPIKPVTEARTSGLDLTM